MMLAKMKCDNLDIRSRIDAYNTNSRAKWVYLRTNHKNLSRKIEKTVYLNNMNLLVHFMHFWDRYYMRLVHPSTVVISNFSQREISSQENILCSIQIIMTFFLAKSKFERVLILLNLKSSRFCIFLFDIIIMKLYGHWSY